MRELTMPYEAPASEIIPNLPNTLKFRPDIEGLRAIAILMVVAFHAGVSGINGGYIGVDIFFVLSGYLITELLVKEFERTGHVNLQVFYSRRAKRLLPASFFLIICVLSVSMAVLSPIEVSRITQSAIATQLYASNLWFMTQATDYFGPGVDVNPLLHTWSLAVEEQFYFVWPFVLLICIRRKQGRKVAISVLCAVAIVSFVICVWLTRRSQPLAFFGTPARTWEFAAGGLAAFLPHYGRLKGLQESVAAWLGLALLLGAGVWLKADEGFPGAVALIPVIGTVLLLISGKTAPRNTGLFRFLGHPVLQRIGGLSYSWYLWHWPVLVFGHILFPSKPQLLVTAISLILGFAMAWITHLLIENPVRYYPLFASRPKMGIWLGVATMVVGLIVSGSFFGLSRHSQGTPLQRSYIAASSGVPEEHDCLTGFRSNQLKVCSFGSNEGETVVLFGDSHAAQWLPGLKEQAANHWHLVTLLKAACPSVSVAVFNPHLHREEYECSQWRVKALDHIRQMKPAVVIVANSFDYVKRTSSDDGYATLSLKQWETGMKSTLHALDTGSTSVLLLRDTPRPSIDVPTCLSRATAHPSLFPYESCVPKQSSSLAPTVWQAETTAAQTLPYVRTVDLTQEFCQQGECAPVLGNVVVYRDSNHITTRFSKVLSPILETQVDALHETN